MERKNHYHITKDYYKKSALERQGFYDASPGEKLKHSVWQLIVRKKVLDMTSNIINKGSEVADIVDVGCGRGDFTLELANLLGSNARIVGCDYTKDALAIAEKNALNYKNVKFNEGNLLELPFKNGNFDLTICINVLHHIFKNDLEKGIKELARISRKHLILEIKNKINLHYMIPKWIDGMRVYPTTIRNVSKILEDCGFFYETKRPIFKLDFLSPIIILQYHKK